MGWLIAAGILILLSLIPIGVCLSYEEKKFRAELKIGFLRFSFPQKKKRGKKPAENKEPAPAPQTPAAGPQKKTLGQKWKNLRPLLRLAADFLGSLRRKIRIRRLHAKIILAGEDPCDLAVLYGRICAGVSALMGQLNRLFVIADQDVKVECDFAAEKTVISCRGEATLTVGKIVSLAAVFGVRALKELMNLKKRKGGAAK